MLSQVPERLAAWRDAERRLAVATDPAEIAALRGEVEALHDAYRKAVDPAAEPGGDVIGHGLPADRRGVPKP